LINVKLFYMALVGVLGIFAGKKGGVYTGDKATGYFGTKGMAVRGF
jgi:hypothetical protein